MTVAIRVEAVVVGRRRAGVGEQVLTVTLEPEPTLRDLVSAVMRVEIAAFERRREERSFVRVLTERALAEGLEAGAVRSGGIDDAATVDPDAALATALLAFEDGLYQVYVDDEEIESLDQRVSVHDGTKLMFLRLVALAGG